MSKRKISITLPEDDWRNIMYILGALSGASDYADAIEEQIKKRKGI